MKKYTIIVLIALVSNTLTSQTLPPSSLLQKLTTPPSMICCPEQIGVYETKFFDDFDNESSLQNWVTAEEWNLNGNCARFRNIEYSEPYYYNPNNVYIENGVLKLKVDVADPPHTCVNSSGDTLVANYNAGMIWSAPSIKFRYGKFEAKFKIPNGRAIWPAFWLWGGDEIDIFEGWGWSRGMFPDSMHISTNIHNSPNVGTSNQSWIVDAPNQIATETWNILICEWTPYKITIWLNGIIIREVYRYYQVCDGSFAGFDCFSQPQSCVDGFFVENTAFPDKEMSVIFQLTLQPLADWSNGEEQISDYIHEFPAIAEVDYIKVEQLPNEGKAIGGWGPCNTRDFCTTRFEERLRSESPALICDSELELKLESSWDVSWDPGIYSCDNMVLSTDPQLNAELNCTPNAVSVNIINAPTNQDLTFQLEIPANESSLCISEGRIIEQTIRILSNDELPLITLDGVTIDTNNIYNITQGMHQVDVDLSSTSTIEGFIISYENQSSNSTSLLFKYNYHEFQLRTVSVELKYKNGCSKKFSFFVKGNCLINFNPPSIIFLNGENIIRSPYENSQFYNLCYGEYIVEIEKDPWYVLSFENITTNETISPISGLLNYYSYKIYPDVDINKYKITIAFIKNNISYCNETIDLNIQGFCCYPDKGQNCDGIGGCLLDAHPNPVSDYLSIYAGVDEGGGSLLIKELNVYNKYMQRVKHIPSLNLSNYVLNVSDLPNNDFYIVESKNQNDEICRKTIMIVRD